MKKNVIILALLLSVTSLFAQDAKKDSKVEFNPHWFMQLQGGAGYTVGETEFKDLISPAAYLSAGYQFSPVWGLRGGIGGWQAKGAWSYESKDYKYKFMQLNVDVTANLSNLLAGYKPGRWFNPYLFLGVGGAYAFDNDEAVAVNDAGNNLEYLWRDDKAFVAGRGGLGIDFRLCDNLSFNLEANANIYSDHFNSKKAENVDWHFNGLAGLTFRFGKTTKEIEEPEEIPAPAPAPAPVVEKKEEPAPAPAPVEPEVISERQDVFFTLNSTFIRDDEALKIEKMANFLKEHKDAKVVIKGYADVQTGSKQYNMNISKRRAQQVADALVKLGIDKARIAVEGKGCEEQPFSEQEKNRVAICVAE